MPNKIIPTETKLAARRGFIRTTLQGYEGILAAGITVNAVLAIATREVDLVVVGVTAAVTLIAPPLAGLRSWMSITSKGIPSEYVEAA